MLLNGAHDSNPNIVTDGTTIGSTDHIGGRACWTTRAKDKSCQVKVRLFDVCASLFFNTG